MLTKENANGFNRAGSYPTYKYPTNSGKGYKARCDMGRITPTPKGHREVVEYQNEDEHFTDYLEWIEEEHKHLTNKRMLESPSGDFIGRWRNARWMDEIKHRGLS